ncbi:hypothetical protein DEO72_LG7g30 [Vigna unguiculata]|uniref:Uncharacterized protein n=1 Tax=Vigna unguiculata TaxID=3917 RepID=A0A4D6MD67_VIGUN|nr:hypothetical protein DEO72_LG7g30 [Vigna unguiculata]
MVSVPRNEPKLIELKELMPLRPWNTPSLPLKKVGVRYVKLKEPIYRDGVRVYWQTVIEEEDENHKFEIPYERLFNLLNKRFPHIITFVAKFVCWTNVDFYICFLLSLYFRKNI